MRKFPLAVFAAAAALALTGCSTEADGGSSADARINRLELIAPAAPGSGWDQTSRAVQGALESQDLARKVEVTNIEGASGTVALGQMAAKQGKEGLMITSGLAMMSGVITNGSGVTMDTLTPLARVVGEYEAIVTPPDSPYRTVDDLFAAIKKDPDSVAIAGGSAGSADHIFIGLLAKHYGVDPGKVNYVPYSGGGEATTALLGGKVQAGIAGVNEFSAQIRDGGLKGLLVSSPKDMANVEFAQNITDVDPSLEFQNWRSMMAPGGINASLKKQYTDVLTRMHDSPAWRKTLEKNAWNDNFLAGDEFATWLKEENSRVQGVLDDLGLSA